MVCRVGSAGMMVSTRVRVKPEHVGHAFREIVLAIRRAIVDLPAPLPPRIQ
jgi:hypothetical protein